MRRNRPMLLGVALAAAATALLLVAFALLVGVLVWSTLDAPDRQAAERIMLPRLPLLMLGVVAGVAAVAALMPALLDRWLGAPARLLEQARVVLGNDGLQATAAVAAPAAVRGLAECINQLAAQRQQLKTDIAHQVAAASFGIEQERNRLAALMAELQQSVIVCNLDGRILLYNSQARLQFRALSNVPHLADGAELIGLGRSIYAVFDRKLVAHALERVQQQMQRGAAHPSAQLVTSTRSGQLLRARMAVVRAGVAKPGDADPGEPAIDSFVLLLDDITDEVERQSGRERLLHGLTEGSRGSLANLSTAVELLDDPALQPVLRERLLTVVREETQAMARRLGDLAQGNAVALGSRWPLDDMLGADFVQAARSRVESALGMRCSELEVDPVLWLSLDSFSLLQAVVHLASRLHDEFAIGLVQLRLQSADAVRAHFDLVWSGSSVSSETVMAWELDPMAGGGAASSVTIREVVTRHGGEFWFERDRARQQAFFRFLLPLAAPGEQPQAGASAFVRSESRPEYFDFDLFSSTELGRALEDRPLASLAYTVFDTETTGLDPSGGDEIIQIGATRVVNGRLLNNECFEQIIDPKRTIPAASIPIHGITPDQVIGQPTLDAVLPTFRAYADETVLVAHNAAFDLRFLQLKEAQTGVVFDLPVLDTLLLSAVVHPNQASHRLEAIAERFGVTVIGRHTALGDAMVTAEVLVKLIPLLADRGIVTLGQARAAAQKTWYARLKY